MKSNPPLIQISGITLSILLLTPLFFVSCGAFQDDNSQPTIEGITDQRLTVGDETTVDVTITDADADDTHIMGAASDDPTVATVSVMDTTLTIEAITAGTSNITVSAIDDSDQDNAAAIAIVFRVTVDGPWVGTWALESIGGESVEQALAEGEELGIDFSVVPNRWTFKDDGTMDVEFGIEFEAKGEGLAISGKGGMRIIGTYSLSGSRYTLTPTTVEGTGILEGEPPPIGAADKDTGTWSREGNTLTLNSDEGEAIVFKKK